MEFWVCQNWKNLKKWKLKLWKIFNKNFRKLFAWAFFGTGCVL